MSSAVNGTEPRFCEGRYGGTFREAGGLPEGSYFPEWGSMLSAPLITLTGLHMIIFWSHSTPMLAC